MKNQDLLDIILGRRDHIWAVLAEHGLRHVGGSLMLTADGRTVALPPDLEERRRNYVVSRRGNARG